MSDNGTDSAEDSSDSENEALSHSITASGGASNPDQVDLKANEITAVEDTLPEDLPSPYQFSALPSTASIDEDLNFPSQPTEAVTQPTGLASPADSQTTVETLDDEIPHGDGLFRDDSSVEFGMRRFIADIPREGYEDRKGQAMLSPSESIVEATVAKIMKNGLAGVPGFVRDKDGNYRDVYGNVYDKNGNFLYKDVAGKTDMYGNWQDKDGNWWDKDGNPLDKDRNWLDKDGHWRDKDGNLIKRGKKGSGKTRSAADVRKGRAGSDRTDSKSSLRRGSISSGQKDTVSGSDHLGEEGDGFGLSDSEDESSESEHTTVSGKRRVRYRPKKPSKEEKELAEQERIKKEMEKDKEKEAKFTGWDDGTQLPPHTLDHLLTEVEQAEHILKLRAIDDVVRSEKYKMQYGDFMEEAEKLTTGGISEIPIDGKTRPELGQIHDDPWELGKEYLEERDIHQLFQFMITSLVREQPRKPLDFLIDMAGEINRQNQIRKQVDKIVASGEIDHRIAAPVSEKDIEMARERAEEARRLVRLRVSEDRKKRLLLLKSL